MLEIVAMKFNTRFNLRRQASGKPEKVYLICRWNGQKFVYPTHFNILPKHWNTKEGRVKNVISEPNRHDINDYLTGLREAARKIYTDAVTGKYPVTKELLKKALDIWTGKIDREILNFNTWIKGYIDTSPNRISPQTGRKISYRTIQRYSTTFDYLQTFQKENRQSLNFESINIDTLEDFRDYLTTVKELSVNTVAKHMETFRQFLRAAMDEGQSIAKEVLDTRKFRVLREKTEHIYLTEKELKAIEKLPLSGTLDRVRDLFLIGCHTGQRISDYNNIQSHNIKAGNIDLIQAKTGARVVIPINATVKSILEKYNGNAPPKISDQKVNIHIKEICKQAGITEKIEHQQSKAGEKVRTVYEKWQLVTSHTARRSFASNMIRRGVPARAIMQLTGHTKEGTFLKYVQLTPFEYAQMINPKKALKAQLITT